MDTKIKVLIVEDEIAILNPYKDYLTMKGFDVQSATDGEQGIEMCSTFMPHIVLLDIMLPKVDGLEVLKQIKADAKLKDVKIILLTALGRDSVIKKGFDLGADAYLIKDQENQETVEKAILKTLKESK